MINHIQQQIDASIKVKQSLETEKIYKSVNILADTLSQGNKILLCGNGGSAADCQHIAAELVVRFRSSVKRKALPAIALTCDTSILTAGGNDIGFENIFVQQVEALGNSGDALIAISTSGNSENVLRAANRAKEKGIKVIGLLGGDGGKIKEKCDLPIVVSSKETARIQEAHLLIEHILCDLIERIMFPDLFD